MEKKSNQLTNKDIDSGSISISNQALSRIAFQATLECYGVVGLVYPSLRDGLTNFFGSSKQQKGIKITRNNGQISLDLYVVIEYGTNLNEVAKNLSGYVKYEIEKYTELKVEKVDVHIQKVKVHA